MTLFKVQILPGFNVFLVFIGLEYFDFSDLKDEELISELDCVIDCLTNGLDSIG